MPHCQWISNSDPDSRYSQTTTPPFQAEASLMRPLSDAHSHSQRFTRRRRMSLHFRLRPKWNLAWSFSAVVGSFCSNLLLVARAHAIIASFRSTEIFSSVTVHQLAFGYKLFISRNSPTTTGQCHHEFTTTVWIPTITPSGGQWIWMHRTTSQCTAYVLGSSVDTTPVSNSNLQTDVSFQFSGDDSSFPLIEWKSSFPLLGTH